MKFNITESSVVDYSHSPRDGLSPLGKSLHIERIFLEEEKASESDKREDKDSASKQQVALEEKEAAAAQEGDFVLDFKDHDQNSNDDERKESHEVQVSEAAMMNISYT